MAEKDGIVALVTGASRGAGRGIAVELGAAGATVYVAGRSVNGQPTTDGVPGTIDQTAGDVSARGGLGIAVRCDHTVDAEVDALPNMPNLLYDLSKHAVARLASAMAQELRPQGIAAVALAPGFMRTERVLEAFRRAGMADRLDGPGGPSETPAYLGRAVVALAADPRVIERSGEVPEVGALASVYGVTDVSGTQPPPFRMPASA
jgi:NAD(P)-dependent dehydrogenase (short-subunit alcohol dehydrogenase family)